MLEIKKQILKRAIFLLLVENVVEKLIKIQNYLNNQIFFSEKNSEFQWFLQVKSGIFINITPNSSRFMFFSIGGILSEIIEIPPSRDLGRAGVFAVVTESLASAQFKHWRPQGRHNSIFSTEAHIHNQKDFDASASGLLDAST